MTYQEIKTSVNQAKEFQKGKIMQVTYFDRFAVIQSDVTGAIIVDNDVAETVSNRRWCIDTHGYPVATIGNRQIRLHDYVMSLMYKEKPHNCYVDHINYDKLDNRRTNLRFVTPLESSQNMPLRSDNKTGVTGICKTKNNKYRVYITKNGKQVNLGYYLTLDEAITARTEGERRLNYGTKPKTIETKCIVV